MKQYNEILTALSYLNRRKNKAFFTIFKDSFLKDKELILKYIIEKKKLKVNTVLVNGVSEYFNTICDEVKIWDFGFHLNIRAAWKLPKWIKDIDKTHKSPNIDMELRYAFYVIENFKIKKKLY